MAQGTLVVICPGSGVPFFTVHLAIVVTLPYLDIGLLTSQGDPCATSRPKLPIDRGFLRCGLLRWQGKVGTGSQAEKQSSFHDPSLICHDPRNVLVFLGNSPFVGIETSQNEIISFH